MRFTSITHDSVYGALVTRRGVLAALMAGAVGVGGCLDDERGSADGFTVSTSAFIDGGPIPREYTCEGENVSPPIRFGGVPEEAEGLALVVDDPDAPTPQPFVHWLLWNIPPDTETIPRDVPGTEGVEELGGARQGTNDADSVGYTGPCPPRDDGAHTYRFTAYALDSTLDLGAGSERPALDDALDGRVITTSRLTGRYDRN